MGKKVTTEDFIKRSIEKHGGFYDYSLAIYVKAKDKVTIICPKHGEFEQTPDSHLGGSGCKGCMADKIGGIKSDTQEDFIEKAKRKHGNTYDYSKVEYKNSQSKNHNNMPRARGF